MSNDPHDVIPPVFTTSLAHAQRILEEMRWVPSHDGGHDLDMTGAVDVIGNLTQEELVRTLVTFAVTVKQRMRLDGHGPATQSGGPSDGSTPHDG